MNDGPTSDGPTSDGPTSDGTRAAVSRRVADARLLLPVEPASAVVVPELDEWRAALTNAGIPVLEPGATESERGVLLVTTPSRAGRDVPAMASVADVIVVGPGGGRALERAGYETTRVVARPGTHGPRLLVPGGVATVARYVFGEWARPPERWKRVRNVVVARAVGGGLAREGYTVGARAPGLPYPLQAAHAVGVPSAVEWFLALGDGDDYQRAVFHVFPRGDARPAWVVKVARVSGDRAPFEADAAGYALLQRHAPHAAALHTPGYLGRCDTDATIIAVERAARGRPFNALLDEPGNEARKRDDIERIAQWITELGRESRAPAVDLEPERARLQADVVPMFSTAGAPPDLVGMLVPVPAVLAHHDLGSWNVVVDDTQFGIVDWESSRFPALPLGDLLYFLTDALVALDGPAPPATKVRRALALLRGEHRHSAWCYARLRDAAHAMAVPLDAIGPLATLTWLHHGMSPQARARRAAPRRSGGERIGVGLLTMLAEPWLADPDLGATWPAFARGSARGSVV